MVVGTAEKPEPVGQDFERPLAEHQPVELDPLLENAEHEVLLLGPLEVLDLLLPGEFDELLHREFLEARDRRVSLLERLVVARDVEPIPDLLGDLLGDAQGLTVGGGMRGCGLGHKNTWDFRGARPPWNG